MFAIPQGKPAALVIFYYSDDDRQAGRQMDRRTDRQTKTCLHMYARTHTHTQAQVSHHVGDMESHYFTSIVLDFNYFVIAVASCSLCLQLGRTTDKAFFFYGRNKQNHQSLLSCLVNSFSIIFWSVPTPPAKGTL